MKSVSLRVFAAAICANKEWKAQKIQRMKRFFGIAIGAGGDILSSKICLSGLIL